MEFNVEEFDFFLLDGGFKDRNFSPIDTSMDKTRLSFTCLAPATWEVKNWTRKCRRQYGRGAKTSSKSYQGSSVNPW